MFLSSVGIGHTEDQKVSVVSVFALMVTYGGVVLTVWFLLFGISGCRAVPHEP